MFIHIDIHNIGFAPKKRLDAYADDIPTKNMIILGSYNPWTDVSELNKIRRST